MVKFNPAWLRAVRRQAHIPIEKAAEAVGKSRVTLWRYEAGEGDITVSMLCRLLNLYRCSVVDVFCESIGKDSRKNDSL